jgi:hypothetical protein
VTRFLALTLGILSLPAFATSWEVVSGDLDETAIVFTLDDIRAQRLPAVIHEGALPPVFSSQVILACIGLPFRAGDLVVYRPASRVCEPFEALPRATRQKALLLSGRSSEAGRSSPGEKVIPVIISPAPKSTAQALVCVCPPPGNQPPVVIVQSGNGQERAPGEAIAPIVVAASDADSPTLTERFTHRVDGGAALNGLPAGLSASCTPGAGTLSCSITGTPPATPAVYQIDIFVSDGVVEASVAAGLTVRTIPPPVNDPPVVSVQSGDGQQRGPGEVIEAIVFSATDADSADLAERFTYRVDGGTASAGLPPGLAAGCTPSPGALSCSVNGTAPAVEAFYTIEFFASDEESEVSTVAGLTVRTVPPPVNDPPVVNVQSGDGQEREPGETIEPIVFTATDADSADLAERFTFSVDGGTVNAGLPAGLAAGCTPGAGTLSCSVTGTAPANEGLYNIGFFVADEDSEVPAAAGLTVRTKPPSVFKDGFEPQP